MPILGKDCVAELIKESAFLELSYNCSFTCPFCYAPWLDHPELYGNPLPASKWNRIIDIIVAKGVKDITLTGGEPLLHPEIKAILTHLVSLDVSFCLYSNCEFLDDTILDILKDSKVIVATSLQGIKNRYILTGSCFSLNEWRSRCVKITSLGIPLSIAIPVTKPLLHNLPKIIKYAAALNPYGIQINPIVVEGRAKYHPELWLDYADFMEVKKCTVLMRTKIPIPISLDEERYCICRESDIVKPNGEPCKAEGEKVMFECHSNLVIGPDGRTRQCLHTFLPTGDMLSNEEINA